MELDDQMHDIDSDAMDMEESDYGMKCQDLPHEAVQYGRELQADYPGDERREYKKTLDDIFSLVAYPDPKSSVHGHLLDPSGRVPVAEELNSAILGNYKTFPRKITSTAFTYPLELSLNPGAQLLIIEPFRLLVSLGKSSSAALERLYQQTEVLINDISEEGGAGAFINVRNDFLLWAIRNII